MLNPEEVVRIKEFAVRKYAALRIRLCLETYDDLKVLDNIEVFNDLKRDLFTNEMRLY